MASPTVGFAKTGHKSVEFRMRHAEMHFYVNHFCVFSIFAKEHISEYLWGKFNALKIVDNMKNLYDMNRIVGRDGQEYVPPVWHS